MVQDSKCILQQERERGGGVPAGIIRYFVLMLPVVKSVGRREGVVAGIIWQFGLNLPVVKSGGGARDHLPVVYTGCVCVGGGGSGSGSYDIQGRIQDFKLGSALKKIAPSGGRRENIRGISFEKSRFYAKKSYFFQIQGGGAPGAPPHWIRPWYIQNTYLLVSVFICSQNTIKVLKYQYSN